VKTMLLLVVLALGLLLSLLAAGSRVAGAHLALGAFPAETALRAPRQPETLSAGDGYTCAMAQV